MLTPEWVPLFSYLSYDCGNGVWKPRAFPPNRCALRDIPKNAVIHESVKLLHNAGVLEDWEVAKAFHTHEHEHAATESETTPFLSNGSAKDQKVKKR